MRTIIIIIIIIIIIEESFIIIDIINIFIIIIIIINNNIIYNSILCPTKQKEKGKTYDCQRCRNSLLNHGNITIFNRA